MARVDLTDLPDMTHFDLRDLLNVQTKLIISLLTLLEQREVMTRAEFGKFLAGGDPNTDDPAEHICQVMGRALASLDPDPPNLSVVD